MFVKIFCIFLFVFVAIKAQFVIYRGYQDVFRNLTGCSDETPDFCYSLNSDKSNYDPCVCRCWPKYPMFRDHDVYASRGGKFRSKGRPGCVWHSNHRYECFHIRKLGEGRHTSDDEEALEFDFSKPGSLQAYADHDLSTCTGVETAIKMPEDAIFKPKTGLLTVQYRSDIIKFMWTRTAERYDGGLVRGVLTGCPETVKEAGRCFVGKIMGMYNGGKCSVRALNGECCILPFKYRGQVYNSCTRAGGTKEAWCAVRIPFLRNETNWRQDCTNSSKYEPSSSSLVQSSPTISISQPPTDSVQHSSTQGTTFSSNVPGIKSSIDLKPTSTAHDSSTYTISPTTVVKYTSSVSDHELYDQTSSTIDHRSSIDLTSSIINYEITPSSAFRAKSIDFTSSVNDHKSSVKISMINHTSSIIDIVSSVTVPTQSSIAYTSSIIDYKPSVSGYSPTVVNYTSSVSNFKAYSQILSTIDHRSSTNYTSSIVNSEITPSSAFMSMSINFTSLVSDYKSSVKLSMINYTSSKIENFSSVTVPTQSKIDYTSSTSNYTSSIIDYVSSVTFHPKQPVTDYALSAHYYTPSIIDHVSSVVVEQSKTDHMQSSIDYTFARFASKLSTTDLKSRIIDNTSSIIDHVSSVAVAEPSKTDHTHSSIDYTSARFASKLSTTDHRSRISDYTSSISVYKTTTKSSKRTMSSTINQNIIKPSFTLTMSPQTGAKSTNIKLGSSMSSVIESDPKATTSDNDSVAVVIIIVVATVAFVVLSLVCCLFIGLRLWKNRAKKYKVINKKAGEQTMQSPPTQRPDVENPVQTDVSAANDSENEMTETEFTIPEKNDTNRPDEKYPSFMTFKL